MRQIFVFSALLFLTGCGVSAGQWALTGAGVAAGHKAAEEGIDPIPPKGKRTAEGYANQFRDNMKKTADKVEEWWFTPLPSKEPLPVQASYCYKAQTDTLCYRQPMPGWEHRLIAYQGTNAAPPPPAVMQLMPKRTPDAAQMPENRMANAQPVFVQAAPDAKEVAKEAAKETAGEAPKDPSAPTTLDSSQEILPDPAVSPQL